MERKIFLGFGVLTLVLSIVLLLANSINVTVSGFGGFAGLILMPVSMASIAAGLLDGSRIKIIMIFLIYIVFFGTLLLMPLI